MNTEGLVMTPFTDPVAALAEAESLARTEQKTYCIIRRKRYMFVVSAEAARLHAFRIVAEVSSMNRCNERMMRNGVAA